MAGEATLADIHSLVEEQGTAFEAFKQSNDERIGQIEKKGVADPVTVDKVEKANTRVGELAAQIDKLILDAKTAADVVAAAGNDNEELKATVVALRSDIDAKGVLIATEKDRGDLLETALKRTPRGKPGNDDDPETEFTKNVSTFYTSRRQSQAGEERISPVLPEDVTEEQRAEYKAYEKAFRHYLRYAGDRYGQDLGPEMLKALSVGIQADGGYWVIPEISNRVITRLFETSPIRQIAMVITIGTDAIEFPNDTNDAVTGGWVGEQDARTETNTPQVGQQRISVHEQFANPRATQKLLDDAQFNVESWLGNKIGSKLARDENIAFVSGNGVARPRGFLDYGANSVTTVDASRSWGVLQHLVSGDASAFDADPDGGDALIDVIHALNPAYRANARWVTNRATLGTVRKMKDSNGAYIWQMGNIQAGQPATLFGFPITEAEDMDDVGANNYPMAFGDFREGYVVVDRQGIRTLRDPFSAKPFVQFYTTKRVGGDVVNYDAIKLLKIST